MDIEATEAGNIEHGLRQDQPVGGDHQDVRPHRLHTLDFGRALQARRLKHLDTACGGKTLYRTRDRAQPASGGPIGLG